MALDARRLVGPALAGLAAMSCAVDFDTETRLTRASRFGDGAAGRLVFAMLPAGLGVLAPRRAEPRREPRR